MDSIEREIVTIERSIVKLFNKPDINSILKYFSEDFVGFSSTKHERITKLSQLKKTFQFYLKEGDQVKFVIKNLKVKIFGETAMATFYWNVDIHKKKKVTSVEGRASHIFLLVDSDWKIVHEHFSKAH